MRRLSAAALPFLLMGVITNPALAAHSQSFVTLTNATMNCDEAVVLIRNQAQSVIECTVDPGAQPNPVKKIASASVTVGGVRVKTKLKKLKGQLAFWLLPAGRTPLPSLDVAVLTATLQLQQGKSLALIQYAA